MKIITGYTAEQYILSSARDNNTAGYWECNEEGGDPCWIAFNRLGETDTFYNESDAIEYSRAE